MSVIGAVLVASTSACVGPDGRAGPSASPGAPTAVTSAVEWSAPGLVDRAGHPVEVPLPAVARGTSVDVTELGADPAAGSSDDAAAIRRAVDDADVGDVVVLPAGVLDLRTTDDDDPTAHVVLRDGVTLRGAGQGRTVLVSSFDGEDDSTVLRASGVRDVVVAGLTITSRHDGPLGTDPDDDDAGGGPMYGVRIGARDGRGSARVLVRDVAVERFQRHGISVKGSREVTVTGCRVSDATSVGAGGSGYGIVVEGFADRRVPGADDDSRHNVVVGNVLDGAHLRHAILLQFPTHNNLVADNEIHGSVLDAIDLHGEGEYLNEVARNTVVDGLAAGIALGNSGGRVNRHDASGEGNWVHGNVLTGNERGVLVILGTPRTVVEDNTITAGERSRSGVEVRNAPGTVVRGNTVRGAGSGAFWAIRLRQDPGTDGRGDGVPRDVRIERNRVTGGVNGIRVDAGQGIHLEGNTLSGTTGTEVRVADEADVRR